ncbi:MAG: DUF4145 domain-containing protein [Jatrophihabitantaceae bacterium]
MTKAVMRTFVCPICEKPAQSPILGVAIQPPGEDTAVEYAFLQCSECRGPLVQWREDFGGGFDLDDATFKYPPPRRLSPQIPRALRTEFDEARKCFDAKAYSAAVVMVRRTLEGTCVNQGIAKGGNLATNLRALQDQGKIDGLLAEWANMLRVVGNAGAHFTGNSVSREDAQDAMDFAEALLDHLFVLRRRFEAFKARQPIVGSGPAAQVRRRAVPTS